MTQSSRKRENEKSGIDEVIEVFRSIDDYSEMRSFFEEIFTLAERRDLGLRWELMKMLKNDIPQREIASHLGISLCKITRGAKIVKNPDSVTNQIMEKIQGKQL